MPSPDSQSPLERVQALFGVRTDGASYQTKRALIEEGEGMPSIPAPGAPITALPAPAGPTTQIPTPAPIGGPSPSQELLDRVRAQGALRGQESLRRIMEQRSREVPAPVQPIPLQGGLEGARG